MKKLKFEKKLSLNKETIAKLNDEQMNAIKGGNPLTSGCKTQQANCQYPTIDCATTICTR